jgi:thiol-disulfide isomerase/thioredoxin
MVGTVLGLLGIGAYGLVLWLRRRRDLVHTTPALVVFTVTAVFVWLAGTAAIDLARTARAETTDGRDPEVSEGFVAPDFTLPSLSGETVSLSSLRGKPVVLTFWATWCGPCRAELPAKMRFHDDWGDRVHVVGVNLTHTEAGREVVDQYVAESGVPYVILLDRRGRVSGLYNLFGTPTTVLIDANGTIVARRFGAVSFEWLAAQTRGLVTDE